MTGSDARRTPALLRSVVLRGVPLFGVLLPGVLGLCACEKRVTPSDTSAAASVAPMRYLSGSFTSVAKRVSGSARFGYVTATDTYQLVLEHVELDTTDPVHVYLMARDEAPTTGSVEETEDKYDLGELTSGAPLQTFDLPSAPAPELRSVVLWGIKYGVNLAQAKLR